MRTNLRVLGDKVAITVCRRNISARVNIIIFTLVCHADKHGADGRWKRFREKATEGNMES